MFIPNVILVFFRAYGFIVIFPGARAFLGRGGILVMALSLAFACASGVSQNPSLVWLGIDSVGVVLSVLANLLAGVFVALPMAVALEVFATGGRVSDVIRGAQYGEQLNPGLGASLSPLENASALGAMVLVFTGGYYRYAVRAFQDSLVGSGQGSLNIVASQCDSLQPFLSESYAYGVVRLSAEAMSAGLCFAAPVLIVSLLGDVGSSVMTRALGRVNVFFETLPWKLLIGVVTFVFLVLAESYDLTRVFSLAFNLLNDLVEFGVIDG